MMKFTTILLILVFVPSNGFGGVEHGNGGDVVICSSLQPGDSTEFPGGNRKPFWVLDYLEGLDRGFEYDLGPLHAGGNTRENREKIIEEFLTRIAKFSPNRASRYREWLDRFDADSKVTSNNLVDVPDSYHLSLPPRCALRQAIIQRAPLFPEDRRYLVSREWALDPFFPAAVTAGLMLHEVVLREAMELGQTNSIKARYFHMYVASTKFHQLTEIDWMRLVGLVGFPADL